MTDSATARAFLLGEVDNLEPFDFVAVMPAGRPAHTMEITRGEDGALEVRVPGRPRVIAPLEGSVRSALRERGFASDDPADPTRPWARGVADNDSAVALVQELLVEVFGEKPDATLDIGHGSHRRQIEAQKKLNLARERIEGIVADLLGRRAEQDADGDFLLPIDEVHVMIAPRVAPDGQIIVRIFSITNVGVAVTAELGLFLARLNFGLMFGRFALDAAHQSIWFDETLLGEGFREEELRFAIDFVAKTADAWDDKLKQMFGGSTYQEILSGRSARTPPPTKPGEGTGLYL